MKRMLFSLPMLGVAFFFVASGLYDALSNYYPESGRPWGFLLAAWGALLVLLLAFAWVRPSQTLLRLVAGTTFLPIGLILLGNIWASFQFGWAVAGDSVAITLTVGIALVVAYFCTVQVVRSSAAG